MIHAGLFGKAKRKLKKVLDDEDVEDGAFGGEDLSKVAPSAVRISGIDPSKWELQELGNMMSFITLGSINTSDSNSNDLMMNCVHSVLLA